MFLALQFALALSSNSLAAQNDQATDVSGTAAGSTVAGGTFSPTGTNPVATAQSVAAVATAAQSVAVSIASGAIPGFTGSASAPAVQAVASLLTGGTAGSAAPVAGGATPQQTVQGNMVGALGLPSAQVTALLASIEGILPTPQPAQLQRAVAAWNDLCRATAPETRASLATGNAPQAIRAVLAALVGAGAASQ